MQVYSVEEMHAIDCCMQPCSFAPKYPIKKLFVNSLYLNCGMIPMECMLYKCLNIRRYTAYMQEREAFVFNFVL